ncbi:DUF1176 domain-containing protein [Pseudanabaena sp. FACHB-1277]|uniref:DUF1176 domain-containing protein n=1 Tax=Pseudanabaena cinerea FACHB-1277 TaxID=2949581 RepID=A0A926UX42_9CYAN|nr:DUF1176 domain-containing protein [Pseudanabaena cinerea]MBD2151617.1 DUF1176 domain-containing protein [Pseudanabaena cinerea FACHB-1277]
MLRQISLISTMMTMVLLGCANQDPPNSAVTNAANGSTAQAVSPTGSSKADSTPQSTVIKVTDTKKTAAPSSANKTKAIATGNIADLPDKEICGNNRVAYAYGETSSFLVYICADASTPDIPRYYMSRNKDGSGGLEIEAKDYNPQKSDVIEFNNGGYLYAIEAPTSQNPEPVMRVTFPNGKVNEEQLLKYLASGKDGSSNNDPLAYVLANREKLGICKDDFRDSNSGMGSRAFKLTDKRYLVQVQCFLAAYQGAFEYVLWIDESPQPRVIPMEFDAFQEGTPPKRITSRSIAGMPRVNVRSQTMTNFTKFRGLGDCGSSALYKLEGDRMVLQEYRAKYECDGKYVQDFPVIYP